MKEPTQEETEELFRRGVEVFGSMSNFVGWLDSKIIAFGNQKPKDILKQPGGREEILNILGRIEHGIFS